MTVCYVTGSKLAFSQVSPRNVDHCNRESKNVLHVLRFHGFMRAAVK